jgi:hypothetical protein
MKITGLNLKTALYDKPITEATSVQVEHNGTIFNISHRSDQDGLSIHISNGGSAIAVYPQAANAIVIQGAPYAS